MSEVKKFDMAASPMADADCLLVADSSGTVKRISLTELLGKVKVGGRNLISKMYTPATGYIIIDGRSVTFKENKDCYVTFDMASPITDEDYGNDFTLSFDVSGMIEGNTWDMMGVANKNIFTVHMKNGRNSVTFKMKKEAFDASGRFMIDDGLRSFPNGFAPITLSNFKLERGNIATDWTPAPEELLENSRGGVKRYLSINCNSAAKGGGLRDERDQRAKYKCGGISSAEIGDDEKRKYARYFRFVSADPAGNILCHCQHAAPSYAGGRQIRCFGGDAVDILLASTDHDGQTHRMAAIERHKGVSRRVAGHRVILTIRRKEVVAA